MTILPLIMPEVNVRVNFQLTRLAELARQLAESLSNRLSWIPSLLVELGVDSTSSLSELMFKSFILLAELYEQLAEFIFIRRTL